MRGHVRKRTTKTGHSWQALYDAGPDPKTGKRCQRSRSFPTKREAERFLREQLHRLDTGTYADPANLTLGDYLRSWAAGLDLTREPTTIEQYRWAVESHLIPELGACKLRELTPETIEAFYADRLKRGRVRGKGGLAPKSVRAIHVTLRKALEDALRSGLLHRNPAALASPVPVPRRDASGDAWTADQLRTFLEYVATDRLQAAFCLLAHTGLRRGELLGLLWADVDLEAGRLHVRRQLRIVANRPELVDHPKSSAGRRAINLGRQAVAVLREHRRRQLEERLARGGAWEDSGLVYTKEDGTPVRPDWFTRRLISLAREAGLGHATPHHLRHTHPTLLLKAGQHPKVVQHRLGHASVKTTLDTYSSVTPSLDREAAEAFEEILAEG